MADQITESLKTLEIKEIPKVRIYLAPSDLETILPVIDPTTLRENCSDQSFNQSKLEGTIAQAIAQNQVPIVKGAECLISKKGKLSLPFALNQRLGKLNLDIQVIRTKSDSELNKLGYAIVDLESVDLTPPNKLVGDFKYTAGYIAEFGDNMIGHITLAYGIKNPDVIELLKGFNPFDAKGRILKLEVDGKPGGEIVHAIGTNLNELAHITINTSIQSKLSGPIVQMYLDSKLEFNLKDIDSSVKTDKKIRVEVGSEVVIRITKTYFYAIPL